MTIGLVSVALSLVLGVVLGGISGYFGGVIDTVIQRIIEILRSIPTIPLWMGLAAALPADWDVVQGLLRHHDHHFPHRLDRTRPGRSREVHIAQGGGFRHGRRTPRLQQVADHLPPHGAVVHQSHHRGDDAGDPRDHHQRDVVELPRAGPATARDQLGGPAAGCPEHPGPGHFSLAALSRPSPSSLRSSRSISWATGYAMRRTPTCRAGSFACASDRPCRDSRPDDSPHDTRTDHAERHEAAAFGAEPEDELLSGRGNDRGRRRRFLRRLSREDARHRRRERLREERHGPVDPADRRSTRSNRRRRDRSDPRRRIADRPRQAQGQQPGDTLDSRGRHRSHLSGAHDLLQSRAYDRGPAHRGGHPPQRGQQEGGATAGESKRCAAWASRSRSGASTNTPSN